MRKLTLFAAAILWLCLLAGACDQGPGLCSIFNTNANACAPPNTGSGGGSNLGPSCAQLIRTANNGFVWRCNIPTSDAALPPPVGTVPVPCDVHVCADSAGDAVTQATALMAAHGTEPSPNGPAITCSGPLDTWSDADDAPPLTTPCVVPQPKETPCAKLDEKCNVMGGTMCCAPNMCDVLVAPTICCLPNESACDLSNDQCCSTDICEDDGDGAKCCHLNGSLCNPNVTFGGCCESDGLICALANNGITYICQ